MQKSLRLKDCLAAVLREYRDGWTTASFLARCTGADVFLVADTLASLCKAGVAWRWEAVVEGGKVIPIYRYNL